MLYIATAKKLLSLQPEFSQSKQDCHFIELKEGICL
jgi:hypothetical protein